MNRREFVKLGTAFPAAAVTATLTLKEDGKPPVDLDVSVLRLQPGDYVVLRCEGYMTQADVERIETYWREFVPGTKALVLSDGLTIDGVLRGPLR